MKNATFKNFVVETQNQRYKNTGIVTLFCWVVTLDSKRAGGGVFLTRCSGRGLLTVKWVNKSNLCHD